MLMLKGITKGYTSGQVLNNLSLTLDEGEILVLLGASGSGKSTLLRIIAGLLPPDAGTVWLGQTDLAPVPAHRRGIGLMFQDFALFPHLSVAENIRYGLARQGSLSRPAQAVRVAEVMKLISLEGYADRLPASLSGGEAQRVALARSLAPRPRLLLLDEPLGSLDATLRDRLTVDLRRILKSEGVTAIYVTHDQREAFAMGDRVAVMIDGAIVQADHPQALYRYPRLLRVAQFLGFENFWTSAQVVRVFGAAFPHVPATGDVLLHPAGIRLFAATEGTYTAALAQVRFEGELSTVRLVLPDGLSLVTYVSLNVLDTLQGAATVGFMVEPWAVIPLEGE